jgi:hypothetical protein
MPWPLGEQVVLDDGRVAMVILAQERANDEPHLSTTSGVNWTDFQSGALTERDFYRGHCYESYAIVIRGGAPQPDPNTEAVW